jgi:ribonuclease inhibitor
MKVELSGKQIYTESDFHMQIAELLDFGQYYGHNLDALWDRLSTDAERPVTLLWRDSAMSCDRLGRETFDRIVRILIEVRDRDIEFDRIDRFEFELL